MSSFEDKLEQKGEQEVEEKLQGDQQQGDQQQGDQQQGDQQQGDQQQGAGDPNATQDQQDQQ